MAVRVVVIQHQPIIPQEMVEILRLMEQPERVVVRVEVLRIHHSIMDIQEAVVEVLHIMVE